MSVGGFLIDRDDWGESINKIDFRTLHHSNELTGVGRQGFDKTSLAFRIDGIKGQRRFPGSAQAGKDHKLLSWNIQVYIFEIVFTGAASKNLILQGSSEVRR